MVLTFSNRKVKSTLFILFCISPFQGYTLKHINPRYDGFIVHNELY